MNTRSLPCITDVADLKDKRVLVRASLNEPVDSGKVRNSYKIRQVIPTLQYLKQAGAQVILITHLGRDPHNTVGPLYEVLKEYLELTYVPQITGPEAREAIENLENGSILLLENVRSEEREIQNDSSFAEELASYAELYVNDAFADSHREHASIVGVPQYLPSTFGVTFKKEYEELVKMMYPEQPSVFVLGGAKFVTKLPLIEKFSDTYTNVCIGGALANDLFRAQGYEVGDSLVSGETLEIQDLLKRENIVLPIDVVVENGGVQRVAKPNDVRKGEKILDIGLETIEKFGGYFKDAKTILWNGPLGNYENDFVAGTEGCARAIAESDAYAVVGGGDTISVIESLGINDEFDFVSTAGGAMLAFLQFETLPGIDAILMSQKEH